METIMTVNVANQCFTTKQVSEITGITPRKIRYWDRRGIVKPSRMSATGRGSKRLYSYKDLLALRTVQIFREQNVSLQKIGKCVRYLKKHLPDLSQPLHSCTLILQGESIYFPKNDRTLVDTVKHPGQTASIALSLSEIEMELRKRTLRFCNNLVEEIVVGRETYQVHLRREDGVYAAEVGGLPGCITQGKTLEQALEMSRDAILSWNEAHRQLRKEGIEVRRRRKSNRKTG
jgi:DNA-binding transcriptional MerR regulator